jgi:hypothetical protein
VHYEERLKDFVIYNMLDCFQGMKSDCPEFRESYLD